MRIFLDTANIDQIRQAAKLGIVSGVTTNPSLVSKEGTADYETVVKTICSIISGSVSVEVLTEDTESMIKEARIKASWAPNVTIKIPVTAAGLEALVSVSEEYDIPLFVPDVDSVKRGGIASIYYSNYEMGEIAAHVAARVLRGEEPGDIPVQTFTTINISVNPAAAERMGATIPQSLIDRAAEIIEE